MPDNKSWTSDAPLVIAHRGASLLAPENTLSAFRLAVELGADAIEFDVKLSRDRVPVILHDMTLDRTTNGTGKIKDTTLDDIKKLDAGSKFSLEYSGEPIPTLSELVEEFQEKILLNIELTNYNTPFDRLPAYVLSIIEKAGILDKVLISSFNPYALRSVNRMRSEVRTALLVAPKLPKWILHSLISLSPHHDLHPHSSLVSDSLVRQVHRSIGRVNVWTVNRYEVMVGLLKIGIDGIISDDVATALDACKEVS
jgi:glycerophosphoryl diester phosphodiesterase